LTFPRSVQRRGHEPRGCNAPAASSSSLLAAALLLVIVIIRKRERGQGGVATACVVVKLESVACRSGGAGHRAQGAATIASCAGTATSGSDSSSDAGAPKITLPKHAHAGRPSGLPPNEGHVHALMQQKHLLCE